MLRSKLRRNFEARRPQSRLSGDSVPKVARDHESIKPALASEASEANAGMIDSWSLATLGLANVMPGGSGPAGQPHLPDYALLWLGCALSDILGSKVKNVGPG